MDQNIAQTPKPNEFPIPAFEAYAMADMETWQAIEFLLTKLEPVHIEDLDAANRECAICQQEYCVSEDPKLSHPPVKMVCGHLFGKPCIIKWLDPLAYWGLLEGAAPRIRRLDTESLGGAKTSCPTCRREFVPQADREPMQMLAVRLWLWDKAYAFAGVARSDKEERSREHLWQYVRYCQSINEFVLSGPVRFHVCEVAHNLLLDYAERLKLARLTYDQEQLRITLEELGNSDMAEIILFDHDDDSWFPFVFNPTYAF